MRFALLLAGFLSLANPVLAAEAPSADDTAKFLAGMHLPSASPLAAMTEKKGWQRHAAYFNAAFARVDASQFSKIRSWSAANLVERRPTLFYFFSGPDFLYANGFYPDASTYVMCGLEPPGAIPDVSKMSAGAMPGALANLEASLSSALGRSFFKTHDMRFDLQSSSLSGTLPVLYVYLARAGKSIREVGLVQLGENGEVLPDAKPGRPGAARGAKITFESANGPAQTLYYFSADLSNGGFAKSGMKAFGEGLGEGNGLVKSASYLLHDKGFSEVRDFLLRKNATLLQDDTGIPLASFDSKWRFQQFGRYLGPIPLFAGRFQAKMAELFRKPPYNPLSFGIGYRYRPNESNLLLAVKQEGTPVAETKKVVEETLRLKSFEH